MSTKGSDQAHQSPGVTGLMGIPEEDMAELRAAHRLLEHPSFAARLSNVVGTPIETLVHMLPKSWYKVVHRTAENAIGKALVTALSSMRREHEPSAHRAYYKALAAGSGAVSGMLGLPGLLLEIPVTTTLMLRSIAEVGRDQGEDIHTADGREACLMVFALGGRSEMDDAADTGYYGVRLALSSYISFTAMQVHHQTLFADGTPTLIHLIQLVAARFGHQLSAHAAARTLPLVGAATAATINTIFMQHFQDMAYGHFTLRRLERQYGQSVVRANFEQLSKAEA